MVQDVVAHTAQNCSANSAESTRADDDQVDRILLRHLTQVVSRPTFSGVEREIYLKRNEYFVKFCRPIYTT